MEFLAELIIGFLEYCFDITFGSTKVKSWIKTLLFILMTQAVTVVLAWISIDSYQKGITDGAVVAGIITVVWAIGMLIAAAYSHKRNWQ